MFQLMSKFDISALTKFGAGFLEASKSVEERKNRDARQRTTNEWLNEELAELSDASASESVQCIAEEVGDVLFVTCYRISQLKGISMNQALALIMIEIGNKWSQQDDN